MQFESKKNNFTKESTYQIDIKSGENLEPLEIAECFKKQFPKEICLIKSAKITGIELGLLFVGLKLQ